VPLRAARRRPRARPAGRTGPTAALPAPHVGDPVERGRRLRAARSGRGGAPGGVEHVGPIAAVAAASGLTTATRAPAARSCATCGASPTSGPIPRTSGASTTTRSAPAARSAFTGDRTPPSTSRVPAAVTGGYTPGTAQLAATAVTSGTPLSRSRTWNDPSRASTAVIRRTGRPGPHGQPRADDGDALGLGHRAGAQREPADAGAGQLRVAGAEGREAQAQQRAATEEAATSPVAGASCAV
jgi:hypothetical protein